MGFWKNFDHKNVSTVLGIHMGFAKSKVNIPTTPRPQRVRGYISLVHHLVKTGFMLLTQLSLVNITSSPKGNYRSPENKQVFLNSSLVSKRFFQLVKGSQLCSPWLTKF